MRSLAKVLTSRSTYPHIDTDNLFKQNGDSTLNPESSNFNPRAWTKALVALQSRDPEKYPTTTSGVAFRNLNVHGYGNPTDYQKTVGNVWLEVPNILSKLGKSNGKHKIDILQDFEGLAESGEMLVVLGPPGSGCPTLLKAIARETHDIFVDEKSYLNYQGAFISLPYCFLSNRLTLLLPKVSVLNK